MTADESSNDQRAVFVVHGRNREAKKGLFAFLRSIGLKPIEWSQAVQMTGKGSPYVGEILEQAFSAAQAVVVLLTPDEIAYLRTEYADDDEDGGETEPSPQARPNVLFEAGMAFGRHPDRTILVELGSVRPFSDVAGRHFIRIRDDSESRKELAQRLQQAGCDVDTTGNDWLTAGELVPPPPPGDGLPLGKRLAKNPDKAFRFTARYLDRGKGSGRLQITNRSAAPIHNLTLDVPDDALPGFHLHQERPVGRLPSGETASFLATRSMGGGADHFDIEIRGETADGAFIETTAFVSLLG